jgi:hypothetical protein
MIVQDISEFSCYNRACLADLTIEFENAFSLITQKIARAELNIDCASGVTDCIFIFCKNCNHLLEFKIKPDKFKITIIGCGDVAHKKYNLQKNLRHAHRA